MPKICKGDIYDFFAKYEQSLEGQEAKKKGYVAWHPKDFLALEDMA